MALERLGSRLRIARINRRLRQQDLAELVAGPTLDRDAQALIYSVTERRVRLKKHLDNDF